MMIIKEFIHHRVGYELRLINEHEKKIEKQLENNDRLCEK